MTPAELDWLMNGAFIYEGRDGSTFISSNYKLRDYGMKVVGRTGSIGKIIQEFAKRTAACVHVGAASAMSAGTAETAQQAQGRSPASAVPERQTPKRRDS